MLVTVPLSVLLLSAALPCICQLDGQDADCQNVSIKMYQMMLISSVLVPYPTS